jgi:hypothetical protein
MNWKFDFSPETSDIFAVVGVGDGSTVEMRSCEVAVLVDEVALRILLVGRDAWHNLRHQLFVSHLTSRA